MEEDVLIAANIETDIGANDDAYMQSDENEGTETTAARLPEFSSWLPGGCIWLYAVPIVLLLFLWLFYPAILILISLILLLWLLS